MEKKKKRKIDWVCVNPDCTKSKSDDVITARPFVVAFFCGKKISEEDKKRKVCRECQNSADNARLDIKAKIKNRELIANLPIIREAAVVLDDSDEDDNEEDNDNNESSESEMEADIGNIRSFVDEMMDKWKIPDQIGDSIRDASQRLDNLSSSRAEIDASLEQIERDVDAMRAALYAPFRPSIQSVEPLDIGNGSCDVIVTTSSMSNVDPNLPPAGPIKRPTPQKGDLVYAMRGKDILSIWDKGLVHDVQGNEFVIKFDVVGNKQKAGGFYKKLSAKFLAYLKPPPVRLQVGTRVIAIFIETDQASTMSQSDFYSGIIAEPPKTMNGHRYLVFFDDGYASYIKHEDIRVVCQQTENAVWEDIHVNSREFLKKYLLQYPERPMVKLSLGQSVLVESEGTWWNAKVECIDASLVKVFFIIPRRKEAIYRGSTRLYPLYKQMMQQRKNADVKQNFARRNHFAYRAGNKPYIEYTRNAEDDHMVISNLAEFGIEQMNVKRAVARKSTTARKNDHIKSSAKPDPYRIRWEAKGLVKPLDVRCAEGSKFAKHQCSPSCMDDPQFLYNQEKQVTETEKLKHFNPLLIPIILGWKRQITKHRNFGKRSIYYVAPCGRRLRSLEEVHRYLRVTHSTLEIDFFNYEWYVHVFNYFVPERKFYQIDDISYGKENVQVSCVNSLDNNYPEYVEYSTVRLPQKDVDIPLDEGFLTCCDCTDDCQDKEKCSCWQLTIKSTAASNPEKKENPNAGYVYRRLLEPVSTGIYECNKFCKCKSTCLNRVAQHPLRIPLQVFKTEKRGWGIRTLGDIPQGGFICIYVGNLYTNEEANKQGQDFGDEYFAELDLIEVVEGRKEGYESDYEGDVEVVSDEEYKVNNSSNDEQDDDEDDRSFGLGHLKVGTDKTDRQTRQQRVKKTQEDPESEDMSSKTADDKPEKPKYVSTRKFFHKDEDFYVMDAKSIGNIGRYLNHSCNPNCYVQNCFVDTHDLRFPWVAFFASCHISAGEELCWDYNYQVDQVQGKEIYCQCGEDSCRGRLL